MIEKYPFGDFVPSKMKYLLLGSFPGVKTDSYDWFYGSQRSQFWPIIEQVYAISLNNIENRKKLFTQLKIGISDIISQCERRDANNSDSNLINITYNITGISDVLKQNNIEKIFYWHGMKYIGWDFYVKKLLLL